MQVLIIDDHTSELWMGSDPAASDAEALQMTSHGTCSHGGLPRLSGHFGVDSRSSSVRVRTEWTMCRARGVISPYWLIILQMAGSIKSPHGLRFKIRQSLRIQFNCTTRYPFPSFIVSRSRNYPSPPASQYWRAFASSGLSTTSTRPRVSLYSQTVLILQTIVHRLAANQHHCCGFLIRIGYVSLCGAAQIDLPGDNGDDHNDDTDAEGPGQELKMSRHGNCRIAGVVGWRDYTRMSRRDATPVAGLTSGPISPYEGGTAPPVTPHRACMPKTIAPLPRGNYWATPHAPFPLDSPNGHAEVFPGAHCVSDGKWVVFYKHGEEVWACNAMYAAAISTWRLPPGTERRRRTERLAATAAGWPLNQT
ncbi:conserved hypothetical protein [Cupriavidus taiwanensis]|nr:conserved hypothetical protein [Cupriavidus taiwanensis]